MALEVSHTTMVRKRLGILLRHDLATIGPGAFGCRSRRVCDMLGDATSGIEQIVETYRLLGGLALLVEGEHVALHDPRALGIKILVFRLFVAFRHVGGTKALDGLIHRLHLASQRYHIAIQFGVVDLRIAPEDPGLSVVVDHHRRIDVIPLAVLIQRFADGIAKRTRRRVGHSHTDSHATRDLRVGTDIPIVLAVALDGLRGPCTIIGPLKGIQTHQRTMIGPVHHVTRRVAAPLVHPEKVGIILIVTHIDIHLVATHHRSGVTRKPCLHNRILCHCCRCQNRHQHSCH